MVFLGLFEFGSLLSGVATSSKMFIVGRAVAGMGGSGIVNGGLTILAKCVPMQKRGCKNCTLSIKAITDEATLIVYMGIMMGSKWTLKQVVITDLTLFSCTTGNNAGALGRRGPHRICVLEMV